MKVAIKRKEIQKILARKSKSQNWLAYRLKITSGYMSQLMCGTRNPSPELRGKILELLPGCDFDLIFKIKS
jgi:hypothetical protein